MDFLVKFIQNLFVLEFELFLNVKVSFLFDLLGRLECTYIKYSNPCDWGKTHSILGELLLENEEEKVGPMNK